MINSIEGAVLHAVLEDRHERAAERLHDGFLDGELIQFYESVSQLLDLIAAEAEARGLRT